MKNFQNCQNFFTNQTKVLKKSDKIFLNSNRDLHSSSFNYIFIFIFHFFIIFFQFIVQQLPIEMKNFRFWREISKQIDWCRFFSVFYFAFTSSNLIYFVVRDDYMGHIEVLNEWNESCSVYDFLWMKIIAQFCWLYGERCQVILNIDLMIHLMRNFEIWINDLLKLARLLCWDLNDWFGT